MTHPRERMRHRAKTPKGAALRPSRRRTADLRSADQAADLARLLADRLALVDRRLVEAVERRVEQRLDPSQLCFEPLLLGGRPTGDRPGLGMSLADDRLGLLASLLQVDLR